tara:strand:+ start:94 stop:480 length:387 start_codon:yes stop_codon:yes gene_type:complete
MANNSSLQYGNYEFEKYGYSKVPTPKLNGGWFTGEKFNENLGHGTVKVVPEIDYIMYENLKSARGVDESRFHYPGYTRPGNNKQENSGVVKYSNKHNMKCISNKAIRKSIQEMMDDLQPYDPNTKYNY